MDRRAAIATVSGTIAAALFVAVATAGRVEYAEPSGSTSGGPTTTTIPDAVLERVIVEDTPAWELPGFVEVILRVVFFGLLAWLVVRYAWRNRPTLHWSRRQRRPPPSVDFDVHDEVAAAITADAEAQQSALRSGTPRNAIVECWLRLEAAVVAAGVPRRPADTSTDLMLRVLATRQIEPTAIDRLAALYREARFSDHPMSEDSRREAVDALDIVHEGLRSAVGGTVAT